MAMNEGMINSRTPGEPEVRESDAVAERPQALAAGEPGIVRRFLAWAQRADAEGRADAVSALARAYLYSDLDPQTRAEAALGLTAALDDPSTLVRRALAEALASAAEAPRHIVLALAGDQSEVASVVLERSPALADAELVDCAAVGDLAAQTALARRPRLSAGVAAALAEIGQRQAALVLAGNLEVELPQSALWRIFERFGDDAETREALLSRPGIPPALRNELAAATARALADFAARCEWLSPERAERIARDAREQATVAIARASDDEQLRELVRRMRAAGTLTVAVLMRALLCGDRSFFVQALAEISGLAARRVAAFAANPAGHGFAALYERARLPLAFLPAFRAALAGVEALRPARGDRISRALAERAIEACEARGGAGLAPIQSLLWRLASEAAREDAREFAQSAAAAPPPLAVPWLEAPNYAPLLIEAIEAVAAALEEVDAPLAPAPSIALDPGGGEALAPPVQLPGDMLAALADAA
jgi:uncharacterized protein (DUF2336 family)